MNKIQKGVLTLLVLITLTAITLFYYTPAAFAASVSSHVRIVGSSKTIWFGDITTDGCTVTDKDGKQHTFSQPVAICALHTASQAGGFTYVAKDFGGSLGLFIETIAEDTSASDFSTYWLYDVNGIAAEVGVSSLVLNNGDSLFFHFVSPNADVNQRAINDGISYLRSQQKTNGQIGGFSGVSGWAIMTFAAAGIDPATVSNGGSSLIDYLSANPPTMSSPATDWERSILAITTAGSNPYNFGGTNYVKNLETFYNNAQIGVTTLVNDDIFGLLALVTAGSGSSSQIKQDALSFILSHQLSDGGFSWSTTGTSDIDTSAASLQALISAQNSGMTATGLSDAIQKAKTYLLSAQNSDGGFPFTKSESSNTSTTAWATMALSSLGVTGKENKDAKVYIRGNQEENGSFKWQPSTSGETFTTSYAVMALTGKFWPMKVFAGNPTPSPSSTTSPSPSPSVTNTPTPSPTALPTAIPTVTPTITPVPSVTANPSPSPSITPRSNSRDQYKEIIRLYKERMQQIREEQRRMMQRMREQIRRELQNLSQLIRALRQR